MPSPVTYWLQQILAVIALTGGILLLSLLPARDLLGPLWPDTVDELLIAPSGASQATRLFTESASHAAEAEPVLARTRPLSLSVVELSDRSRLRGFPVGLAARSELPGTDAPDLSASGMVESVEPGQDMQLMTLPAWLQAPLVAFNKPLLDLESTDLVLLDAQDQPLQVPLKTVHRLYRPNQLSLTDRIGLLATRVAERWHRAASDAERFEPLPATRKG